MTSIADYTNDDDVDISAIVAAVETDTTVAEFICSRCGGPKDMEDTAMCLTCCSQTCEPGRETLVGNRCSACHEMKRALPGDGPGPQPTEDHQLHTVCCNCGWDYTFEDSMPQGTRKWDSVWESGYFYGDWRQEDGSINEYFESEDIQWDDAQQMATYLICPECSHDVQIVDGKAEGFAKSIWVGPDDDDYMD